MLFLNLVPLGQEHCLKLVDHASTVASSIAATPTESVSVANSQAQHALPFVTPTPREELDGDLGLTLAEVAASVGQLAIHLRARFKQALKEDANRLNLRIIRKPIFNSNGVKYDEYVVDVRAAKWIVTQIHTELSQRYCLYLIDLESKVESLASSANSDPILAHLLVTSKIRELQLKHGQRIASLETVISDHDNALLQLSVSSDPERNAELTTAIRKCARASGGAFLNGQVRKILKTEFGHNEALRTLEDQIQVSQLHDVLAFLDTYRVPADVADGIRKRSWARRRDRTKRNGLSRPPEALH